MFMSDKFFVDTNILVYARDAGAGQKHVIASALLAKLWRDRTARISVQVLNEYYVTVTRKLKPGMAPDEAWSDVEALKAWEPVPSDWKLLESARVLHRLFALSWWDALVVAAAQRAGCTALYSEDLADGADFGGVVVKNPFAFPGGQVVPLRSS